MFGKERHGGFYNGSYSETSEIEEQNDKLPTQFQRYGESVTDTIPENGNAGDQFQLVPDMEIERVGVPLSYFQEDVGRPLIKRKKGIKTPFRSDTIFKWEILVSKHAASAFK